MHTITEEELDKQITIDGEFVIDYKSIQLNQSLHSHHSFEIVLDIEVIEQAGNYTLEHSRAWLGKEITTNASGRAFKGIILDIEIVHDQIGLHGELILKGFSQSILLESGKQQKSWLEQDLSSIISDILGTVEINNVVNPTYSGTIPYACQYGESNYAYIQRLAHKYNEWFFFNGTELVFGRPQDEEEAIELEYSKDIKDLKVKVKTFTPNLATYSYNSLTDEVQESEQSASGDTLNNLGALAVSASQEIYGESKDFGVSDFFMEDQSSLDAFLEKRLQGISAGGNILEAKSSRKGLQLGTVINVNALKQGDEGEETVQHYGEYIIVEINHLAQTGGAYLNMFRAIPATVETLPVNASIRPAKSAIQVATVLSNEDPEGKGRVQVQFHWQVANNEKTDFIRVMTSDAGSSELTETNRGFVFIPEVGDQVMVGFEHNDPNRPFVMGSMFTGLTGAGGSESNVKKSIVTRSGHTIELDDTDDAQKITIKDNEGSIIMFDTAEKSLYVQATENLELSARNVKIAAQENIELQAEGEIIASASSDVLVLTEANLKLQSSADTTVRGQGNVEVEATGDATFKGMNAVVEGQTGAELNGAQAKVNGSAMTEVSGAVVKIN